VLVQVLVWLLQMMAQLGREQVFLQWVQVRAPKGRSVQSPPQVQVPAPVRAPQTPLHVEVLVLLVLKEQIQAQGLQ
jgi:hypothetical protein